MIQFFSLLITLALSPDWSHAGLRQAKALKHCSVAIRALLLEHEHDLLARALEHPSNPGLVKVTSPKAATAHALRTIFENQENLSRKEHESQKHQDDVIHGLSPSMIAKLKLLGFDYSAFVRGVADSDKGKLGAYLELLTERSEKSDILLSFLRGRAPSKSVRALRETLDKMGFERKWLLNADIENDDLRALFQKHGILKGYLHELPGMADAVLLYEKGALTKEQFQRQIAANLFHNGPSEGFWKQLNDTFLPGALAGDKNVATFFKGTVFEGAEPAQNELYKPIYPSPKTIEGIVHTLFDRMSQATRGGVVKIFEEIRGFDKRGPLGVMEDLLFTNPKNTLKQIEELRQAAKKLENPNAEPVLKEFIDAAIARVIRYQNDVARGIQAVKDKDSGKITSLEITHSDGRKTIFSEKDQDAELVGVDARRVFADRLRDEVESLLLEQESVGGDPVRDLNRALRK